MNYGKNLMLLRERIGLTHVQVACILKISDSLYNRYEKEKQTIPIKHLNTLCNYYKVSIDFIFGFAKKKQYNNSLKNINKELSSQRLKELRKEKNITQDKLAEILSTDNSTISKYERSINTIATPFLYTICKKYNISADYLLGKVDEPKYLQ